MSDPNTPEPREDDEWASALAEQGAADEADDPWAAALAEQGDAEQAAAASPAPGAVFKPLGAAQALASPRELEMIMDIPVKLSVELGRTRITIKQLLELAQGSVLALDGLAGEPMDILINSYLVAQGEVVVVDDRYGIRITEIITPSERVQKLNR
ncbi:flagellar motor switch protein FliN [Pseudomonas sp. CC120222-01a]|uniref:flagellar motor switch protein FliN n=1 Tax=Pseudomonas sp. CC120222-01a TaxID=1378075 RepID=UPI000D9471B2|nr:flagellar motor switch protein FliN [Pseudomonas sp. CC120222-01a]PVZ40335.1 flagellar motor switch protein FliN/FliY [Pseudomonas sp. CC120222-01a]